MIKLHCVIFIGIDRKRAGVWPQYVVQAVNKWDRNTLSLYRGSPTSTVSTSTISTSTIFIAIGIKSVLVEFSRFCYVVKFVLVEIAM